MATVLRNILTSLHGRETGLARDRSLIVRGEPDQVTMVVAAGATNIATITIQSKNNEGDNFTGVQMGKVWISDSSLGAGVTATASTTVVGATTGTFVSTGVALKAYDFLTNTLGTFVMAVTNTSVNAFTVCCRLHGARKPQIQTVALVAASYGP